MARLKIEMGIDQFLEELKELLGPNSKKVQGGLGFEGVVIPVEVAGRIIKQAERFLEREGGSPSPEAQLSTMGK